MLRSAPSQSCLGAAPRSEKLLLQAWGPTAQEVEARMQPAVAPAETEPKPNTSLELLEQGAKKNEASP